mmetsp:Transcript_4090/g.7857  ORF Transcript_4090/g.7857 Transcript_4090/m.7857 type:complete len:84 (-) Transcript_4090:4847-5098(-)
MKCKPFPTVLCQFMQFAYLHPPFYKQIYTLSIHFHAWIIVCVYKITSHSSISSKEIVSSKTPRPMSQGLQEGESESISTSSFR